MRARGRTRLRPAGLSPPSPSACSAPSTALTVPREECPRARYGWRASRDAARGRRGLPVSPAPRAWDCGARGRRPRGRRLAPSQASRSRRKLPNFLHLARDASPDSRQRIEGRRRSARKSADPARSSAPEACSPCFLGNALSSCVPESRRRAPVKLGREALRRPGEEDPSSPTACPRRARPRVSREPSSRLRRHAALRWRPDGSMAVQHARGSAPAPPPPRGPSRRAGAPRGCPGRGSGSRVWIVEAPLGRPTPHRTAAAIAARASARVGALILRVRVLAAEVVALAPDARARETGPPRRLRRGGCERPPSPGYRAPCARRRSWARAARAAPSPHRRRRATQGAKASRFPAPEPPFLKSPEAVERRPPRSNGSDRDGDDGTGTRRRARRASDAKRAAPWRGWARAPGPSARRRAPPPPSPRARTVLEVLGDLEQRPVDADARLLLSVNARRR